MNEEKTKAIKLKTINLNAIIELLSEIKLDYLCSLVEDVHNIDDIEFKAWQLNINDETNISGSKS